MQRRFSYDPFFLFSILALLAIGMLALASASLGLAISKFDNPYYYILHQIGFGLFPGIILFYLGYRIPYIFWRKHALLFLGASIVLMLLVFIPNFGFSYGGARRWIAWGPFSFQPSELMKFAFIMYLAAWLETKSHRMTSFVFGFLPFIIMSGFIASLLVLQPDI